ncbi:hypothetical protein PVIIG_06411 [Plasmodium vivax India VII]|uniref:Uncharacterized protein n=1 Tax=Plasmodium vivax India VII TaxID=1077284 RepID=A0A0J9S266_PLAVI|nr:hypothetical protein PVIIG_06411 [Plasmodium vivax India VII]
MFERNIKRISAESDNPFHDITEESGKLCFYLKYWFYDWIISKNIEKEQITELLNLWDEQKDLECTKCDCEFFVRELLEINKLKKFYDFYLFSEAFSDDQSMNKEIYDKEYCNYLKDAKAEHSLLETLNYSKNPEYFKEIFSYIKPYVNLDNYSLIYCDDYNSSEEDGVSGPGDDRVVGGDDRVVGGVDRVSGGPDRVGGNPDEVAGVQEVEEEDEEGDEGEPNEEDAEHLRALPDIALRYKGAVPGPHFRLSDDDGHADIPNSGTNSSDNKTSTGSIASASSLGIIGISFLLYKIMDRSSNSENQG